MEGRSCPALNPELDALTTRLECDEQGQLKIVGNEVRVGYTD